MKEQSLVKVEKEFYADPVNPGEKGRIIPAGEKIVVTNWGRMSPSPAGESFGMAKDTFEYDGVAYTMLSLDSYTEAVDTPDDDTSQQT